MSSTHVCLMQMRVITCNTEIPRQPTLTMLFTAATAATNSKLNVYILCLL